MSTDALRRTLCLACGHSANFHGNGRKPCGAVGCDCAFWVGPTLGMGSTVSVTHVARHLHRPLEWVRDHADDLGGIYMPVETTDGHQSVLRFRMEEVLLRAPDVLDRP